MAELSLEERMRTGHVKRWQIVRVAREQTVAEHLYLVRVLTLHMCEALGLDGESTEVQVAQNWALEHDVPEVKTGDLATPVKAAMRAAVPDDDPIKNIELSYSDSYRLLHDRVKNEFPHIKHLVKLADLLEAVRFLEIEGMGVHARQVRDGLWTMFCGKIEQAKEIWPQYQWSKVYMLGTKLTGA